MIRRFSYILNRYTLTDSGTLTIPINLRDVITALWIEFRATNGATNNQHNTVHNNISAIELIDGGDVLSSITGAQAYAATLYGLGWHPYMLITEVGSNVQDLSYCMRFGRYLGDQQYALDPSQFKNPQVRITWNLATVTAVGATGFVSGTGTLTVYAEIMEGAPIPQAFLGMKQLYQATSVASGVLPILLPTDRRIKGLLLRAASDSGGGLYGVSNVKLQGDQSKVVFFDVSKTDLQRYISLRNAPFSYKHVFHAADGDTLYPLMKQDEQVNLMGESGDRTFGYLNYGIGSGALDAYLAGSAATADAAYYANVLGWLPEHAAFIDLGDWGEPASWLDPTPYKALQLELTQNAASSALSVVLETENPY
jgi:hypothetical protein